MNLNIPEDSTGGDSHPPTSKYPNRGCPNCGGKLHGDGYGTVLHCEFADEEDYWYSEPDAEPVFCRKDEQYIQ